LHVDGISGDKKEYQKQNATAVLKIAPKYPVNNFSEIKLKTENIKMKTHVEKDCALRKNVETPCMASLPETKRPPEKSEGLLYFAFKSPVRELKS
jgi:hypothetical protein